MRVFINPTLENELKTDGVLVRRLKGAKPLSKISPFSFNIVDIKRELKRGEASLNILPPLLLRRGG